MRILFVFDEIINPSRGGIQRVTGLLADEMKRRGHDVMFLAVAQGENKGEPSKNPDSQLFLDASTDLKKQKFEEILLSNHVSHLIFQGINKNVTSLLPYVPSGIRKFLVLHNRPFHLHGLERKISSLTVWNSLGRNQKILKLVGMLCPPVLRKLEDKRMRGRLSYIAAKVDKIVLLSAAFEERLLSLTPGLNAEKVASVNNPNTFEIGAMTSSASKENIILFVARMDNRQKNITGFIDVWKKFSSKNPDWRAKIVGDGPDAGYVKGYAIKKGVERLDFEGNKKNIGDYYSRAKILCMTSTYEGWPMVLAEAMAYGCVPVLFDSFEAASDLVENEVNGLLIRPFNTEEMASSLSRLAGDEAWRVEMAAAGVERIKKFSVENIVGDWERLLICK